MDEPRRIRCHRPVINFPLMGNESFQLIHFTRTDASSDWLPHPRRFDRTERNGMVDYLQRVETTETAGERWLFKVSHELSALDTDALRNARITEWPEGYHLYLHCKGSANRPRRDYYLLGKQSYDQCLSTTC